MFLHSSIYLLQQQANIAYVSNRGITVSNKRIQELNNEKGQGIKYARNGYSSGRVSKQEKNKKNCA